MKGLQFSKNNKYDYKYLYLNGNIIQHTFFQKNYQYSKCDLYEFAKNVLNNTSNLDNTFNPDNTPFISNTLIAIGMLTNDMNDEDIIFILN